MEQITREEMIRMAVETRKKVTSVEVAQEELQEYPVTMEHLMIPTREGDASTYFAYCGQREQDYTICITANVNNRIIIWRHHIMRQRSR